MPDQATVRLTPEEQRIIRITSLVTLSTSKDWQIIRTTHNLSAGDLFTLAVALIKNHPNILKKDYELKEKE